MLSDGLRKVFDYEETHPFAVMNAKTNFIIRPIFGNGLITFYIQRLEKERIILFLFYGLIGEKPVEITWC